MWSSWIRNNEYKNVVKKFCDESSIHSLQLINGVKAKTVPRRIFWVLIFTFFLSLAIWRCVMDVKTYLNYEVKTSVTYTRNIGELNFPAITVCNKNMFRRRVVAPSKFMLSFLTRLYAFTEGNYKRLYEWNTKSCKSKNDTNRLAEFDKNPRGYLTDQGFEEVMFELGMDSKLSVAKCWWKGIEKSCDSILYDHFTINGQCFTLNPSKGENIIYKSVFGNFGESITNNKILTTPNAGPGSGLRLLLNVNQDEYCGFFWNWKGAGFNIYIHDQTKSGVILNSVADIFIQPGKSYDISVRPIKNIKKTESLGYCRSTIEFKDIGVKGTYLTSACTFLCYVKRIYKKCECLALFVGKNSDVISRILAVNNSLCELEQWPCFSKYTEQFFKGDTNYICKECLPQCSEMTFAQSITEKIFPAQNDVKMFQNDLFCNVTRSNDLVAKNFVVLNIYFESMFLQTITESQLFDVIHLIMYIGSSLCLFIGMSLISWFEPLHIIITLIYIFLRNFWRKNPILKWLHYGKLQATQKKLKRCKVIKIKNKVEERNDIFIL